MREQLGREITAEDVLVDAIDPKSPFHDAAFYWDDDRAAAQKYRLDLARRIITSIVVYVEVTPSKPAVAINAFVNVSSGGKAKYDNTMVAFSQPTTRNLVVEAAKRQFLALKKKYEHLSELKEVFEAIEKL